jgi:hypothetical protein
MSTAKNINDLVKLLNKKYINKALSTDVEKVARKTLKEHVVEDVYDAYDSNYQRTGGLLQDRNIDSKMENDNTLSIRSTREENGRDIAYIIETGEGYNPSHLDDVIGERPFHEETYKELKNGLAKKTLAEALKKQGLDIK